MVKEEDYIITLLGVTLLGVMEKIVSLHSAEKSSRVQVFNACFTCVKMLL